MAFIKQDSDNVLGVSASRAVADISVDGERLEQ